MDRRNTSQFDTAFTASIEAKEGVTTGISAADRSRTIHTAIDTTKGKDDLTTRDIFPLVARMAECYLVLVYRGSDRYSKTAGLNLQQ